jgi:proline iminopeptidase
MKKIVLAAMISFLALLLGCQNKTEETMHQLGQFTDVGFIEVTGGKIWYKIVGKAQPGIPLLVLHGGPGVPHNYLRSLDALANERPVIYYDQLGCGNSEKPEDTTLWQADRFADELETLIHYFQLEKVHILGQSWGTMLAMEYMATKAAEMVQSLILAAPALSVSRWNADQRNHILSLPEDIQHTILDCEARGDFANPAYQEALMVFYGQFVCRMDPWPEILMESFNTLAMPVYNTMWGPSEFTQTGNLRNFERAEDLRNLEIPVLFTCGEYDEATPATTDYYKSLTPKGEIVVFEGASHIHHLENETAFNETIRKFLNKNE